MTDNQKINPDLPIPYQKWFEQFSEIETTEPSKWKSVHLIAYFAKRYVNYYNIEYTFRLNTSAPSKCYEVWQIGKLTQMISKDPQILKSYIDWVFDKKIIERKKRITTLAILTDVDNINFFKWQILQPQNIDRTTQLPPKYTDVVKNYDVNIKTYGELAFAKQMTSQNENYMKMFEDLSSANIDLEVLSKVK